MKISKSGGLFIVGASALLVAVLAIYMYIDKNSTSIFDEEEIDYSELTDLMEED